MEDSTLEELKLAINNLIWMHGDKDLKLEEADDKAIKIMQLILDKPSNKG